MFRPATNRGHSLAARQRGAAVMLVLLLVGMLIAMFAVVFVNDLVRQNAKQRQTSKALAQAKEALIGHAVAVDLSAGDRPGDLPCPDTDDDGEADGVPPCNGNALGRLPWKTLGLADPRDGDGERLWYAVSVNFKNSPRTSCPDPAAAGCLNSSTRGTITLRNRDGVRVHNGTDATGVFAVVIAPGAILQRTDAVNPQARSGSGVNVATNYLDIGGGDDNATFADNDADDGFISGPIYDANNRIIVNDTLLAIEHEDLIPLLERRVAREALSCLNAYAQESFGRYPWAAPVNASGSGTTYTGVINYRFGRVPDNFSASLLGLVPETTPLLGPIVTAVCGEDDLLCVRPSWPATSGPLKCSIPAGGGGWWLNWKDSVFYGFAPDYVPSAPLTSAPLTGALLTLLDSLLAGGLSALLPGFFDPPTAPGACGTPGSCLTVNPPSPTAGRKVVVVVAGRPLAGQLRSTPADRQTISNYLEDANDDNLGNPVPPNFTTQPRSTTFNDFVLYQ